MSLFSKLNRTGRHFRPPVSHIGSIFAALISLTPLFSTGADAGAQAQAKHRHQKLIRKVQIRRQSPKNLGGHPVGATTPQGNGNLLKGGKTQEKEIRKLLRWMLKPQSNFSGMESTWANNASGGVTSEQEIKGDVKGRVLRRFLSPTALQDDLMLTGNGQYLYYNANSKSVVSEGSGLEQRLEQIIQQGMNSKAFRAQITGNQVIAGRNSTIIEIASANTGVKLWLDTATGIKLSHEIRDAQGLPLSRSWLTTVAVGEPSGVTEQDFQRKEFETGKLADKRENFNSLEEAIAKSNLKMRPILPKSLAPGFQLIKVTVVTPNAANAIGRIVVLHFSDRVNTFAIQERFIKSGKGAPENLSLRPNRWRIPLPDGKFDLEVIFKGRLRPEQIQALHDSLR